MSDAKQGPSDLLQHIQFEGCDVCVIAPEDYDALVAALETAQAEFTTLEARLPDPYRRNARACLTIIADALRAAKREA